MKQSGDIWQSKTLFLASFDLRSSIFDYRLPGVKIKPLVPRPLSRVYPLLDPVLYPGVHLVIILPVSQTTYGIRPITTTDKKFDNEINVSEFGAEISVNKGLKVHSNESHEK